MTSKYNGGSFMDYYNYLIDFIRPTSFPKKFKQMLEKYGDYEIFDIIIGRDPISKGVQTLLDFVSFGSITKNLKNMHYDDLFHLYLVLSIEHPETKHQQYIHLRLEKNHVIAMKEYNGIPKEYMPVNMHDRTILLAEFIANGKLELGDDFVRYDAVYNNCQMFVKSLLKANNLLTSEEEKFIMQDISKVLSSPVYGLSRLATDLAHIFGHYFGGRKRKY